MTEPFGVESPAYVAIRWGQYVALLLVIGATVFSVVVLALARHRLGPTMVARARERSAGLAIGATLALGATALMRLLAQSYAMGGEGLTPDSAMIVTLLRATLWGHAWLLEVCATGVALIAFIAARRGRQLAWKIAAAASGALTFSMALSGHAAGMPTLRPVAIIADTLHVVGAGGWLGSLLFVIVVGIPTVAGDEDPPRWNRVGALVTAFSPVALSCASLTVVTGAFAAWLHLDTMPALWQTRYGQVLLLKLALLSATAGIGLYNWRRVAPGLGSGPAGARLLRRSSTLELMIGVAVLLITAVLVATPTALDM